MWTVYGTKSVSRSARLIRGWEGRETGKRVLIEPTFHKCPHRSGVVSVEIFPHSWKLSRCPFIFSSFIRRQSRFSYKKLRKIFSVHLHERHHYQQGVAKQSTQSHCSVCCHKLALSQIQHPQQATLAALSPIPPLYHSSRGKVGRLWQPSRSRRDRLQHVIPLKVAWQ